MSQQEQSTQTDNDFLAGFNEVRPADGFVPPAVKEEVKVESEPVEAAVAEPEKKEAEAPNASEASGISIAGFSEDEIKRLLERAARFDELETQVRKANGKIGELNGKLQEYESKRTQQPTQSAPAAAAIDNPELQRWADDYPELVQLAESRANAIAEAKLAEKLQGLQVPDTAAIKQEIYRETQLELMDTLHEGWRDTLNSQEFGLWIAAQPEETQQLYSTTERANDLSKVLKGFDAWKKGVVDRGAKSKQRLEAALTPDGAPSRATQAPSAEDEFVAGFRTIRPT